MYNVYLVELLICICNVCLEHTLDYMLEMLPKRDDNMRYNSIFVLFVSEIPVPSFRISPALSFEIHHVVTMN